MIVEKTEDSKDYSILQQSATLIVSTIMYTTSMAAPAMAEISNAFPDASIETIKLILAIPALMMVIFSLVTGQLTKYVSLKKVMTVSLILIFIGGILPAFFGGIKFVLFMRIIFSIGYGISFPLGTSVIIKFYSGVKRDKMIGYHGAVGALLSVIFQLLGGLLAGYYWRYSFLGFLLIIPVFIMIVLYLPENKPLVQIKSTDKGKKLTKRTYILSGITVLVNIMLFSYMTDIAVIISTDKIGNSSSSAAVLTVFSATAFVVGLFYDKFYRIFNQFIISIAIFIFAAAFLIFLFAKSIPLFIIGAIIYGLGFGIYNPSMAIAVSGSDVKPQYSVLAISVFTSATGLGQFISPYVLKTCRLLLGAESLRVDWMISAIILFMLSVITVTSPVVTKG